jgi:hypothetical protein
MNFIEVLEYLRQSPTNCVTHEEWLTKENKAIRFIGCFDKINIDQIDDIGDISKERFSNLNLMLSNRWLKLQDWHKSKKEHTELHTELHTFEEACEALVKGDFIRRSSGSLLYHNAFTFSFNFLDVDDIKATDWIIREKK